MYIYIYKQGHDIRELPRHILFKVSYSRWTTGEQIPNVFEFWFWIKKWRRGSAPILCLLITDYNTSLSWHLSVWNIYIHHPRIFLHSIHHAWCLWVKMKLVSDDWLTGEWVAFLSNGNTQVNKISGDIFNSTDISPSDLPTHPHRQYNDLSTDSNSRKWLFYSIDISPPDLPTHPPTPTIQWLVDRL